MTDFIYENGALPGSKTTFGVTSAPPDKRVTADEFNTVTGALASARTAIKGGIFHGLVPQSAAPPINASAVLEYAKNDNTIRRLYGDGTDVAVSDKTGAIDNTARAYLTGATLFDLASNPSAALSAAGHVRLRSNAGVLEVSQNGGAYGSLTASTTLSGDVTGSGVGTVATTVALVGGSSAANVHAAEVLANAATALNTANQLIRRDGSGNFAAGTITAALIGNVTGNVSGSAASFTGNLAGDVTGPQGTTVVASVGGSSASLVHAAELLANAATSANTANTIVKRDSNGDVIVRNITAASFIGAAAPLGGLTATQLSAPVISTLTATTGTLTAGTKYYKISTLWNDEESDASAEQSITVGASSGVILTWGAISNATGYNIYRGTATGGELFLATVGAVTTYTDTGAITPSGALPAWNQTGGIYMLGNITTVNAGGMVFSAPNVSNAVNGSTAVSTIFRFVAPTGWTGANAAGKIFAVEQPKGTSIFSVDRFGQATVTGQFTAPLFCGPANTTFNIFSNEADVDNTYGPRFGYSGSMTKQTQRLSTWFGNYQMTRAYVDCWGAWNGLVNATGLASRTLPAPVMVTGIFTQNATGSLANGTYYYKVSAVNELGETLASTIEQSYTITTGGVKVTWKAVPGAIAYNVYGRNTGAQLFMAQVSANMNTNSSDNCLFTDDGSITPSGALPTKNTTNGVIGGFDIKAMPTPAGLVCSSGAGTLTAATYSYKVSAVNAFGETLTSAAATFVRGTTGGVVLNWNHVHGAHRYNVYGRVGGSELFIATVEAPSTTYTDSGSITPSGAQPTLNTTGNLGVIGRIIDTNTGDSTASPGNATINAMSGRTKVAASAQSVTITNAYVGTKTNVYAWIQQSSDDATATRVKRTSVSGSTFTITLDAVATSDVVVAWELSGGWT
jgi:hypothetical protein